MPAAHCNGSSGLWSHLPLKKSAFPNFILKLMPALFQTDGFLKDNNNAAQRLLDGMNFMAQSVSELSLGPTKAVTSWLTDQIAPAYWRPNSQILVRSSCWLPYSREKLCIAKVFFLIFLHFVYSKYFLFYCTKPLSYSFGKTELLSTFPILVLARGRTNGDSAQSCHINSFLSSCYLFSQQNHH